MSVLSSNYLEVVFVDSFMYPVWVKYVKKTFYVGLDTGIGEIRHF